MLCFCEKEIKNTEYKKLSIVGGYYEYFCSERCLSISKYLDDHKIWADLTTVYPQDKI